MLSIHAKPKALREIMIFFPDQGKFREFCGWPGKFRKDLESQGIENKWLWQYSKNLFILFTWERKYFLMR